MATQKISNFLTLFAPPRPMAAFPSNLPVLTVAITGAAGQIGYSLAPLIAQGLMFGPHQKVALRLLDLGTAQDALSGVRMELLDCALPLLHSVDITADPHVAFTGADAAVLCGAFPRRPGMERQDLLLTNAGIFKQQGRVIRDAAAAHCRVLVVGNPANTNALILATSGGLNPAHVSALTRLDHNRAVGLIAARLGPTGAAHRQAVIWGNHSATQVPDVESLSSAAAPLSADDAAYFHGEFIPQVQQRGAEVMKLRGLSSALSAAKAIVDHMRDWILGSEGRVVSMAVPSAGNPYGVPAGLIYSFPVTCAAGVWHFAPGAVLTEDINRRMDASTAELVEERTLAGL